PERGGSIEDLRSFVNAEAAEFPLLVAWLVAGLRPTGPYPPLELRGEQGSAKSTTARVLRSLIDPNRAALRVEPREPRDLAIAAKNGWIVAFDNLSHLPVWLSDGLCRLSTGGGLGTRRLYTDDEEALFDAQRPAIWTGIGEIALRSDLVDRGLFLTLPRIKRRRTEQEFWEEFARAQPRILGALLDAVATGMRNLPTTFLDELPRMADFALWVTAAEEALPWPAGTFMKAYLGNRREANLVALEGCPVAGLIRQHLGKCPGGVWEDTAQELLDALAALPGAEASVKQKGWPANARALKVLVTRLAPNLRASGIEVQFPPRSGNRKLIRLVMTQNGDANGGGYDANPSQSPDGPACSDANPQSDPSFPASSPFAYVPESGESREGPGEGMEGQREKSARFASFADFGNEQASFIRSWAEKSGWPRFQRHGGLPVGPGRDDWERWFTVATPAQLEAYRQEISAGANGKGRSSGSTGLEGSGANAGA
ncbi:MAG TPA: hypothetical protein VK689_13620, partial [Armatimonadota bacterium]|nr:hypothetical protein [Armatimonadota bacterium]